MRRVACVLAAAMATISIPKTADAVEWTITSEFEPQTRRHQLGLLLQGYFGSVPGFIPGLLYGFPVAPRGFISRLNDVFFIEAGAFLGAFFRPAIFWLTPVAGVRWAFHLTQRWAVFAAFRFGWSVDFDPDTTLHGYYVDGTVGAHWKFSNDFYLRLETGGARHGYRAVAGITWLIP